MPFSKSFPKQSKTSVYPQWEEISLTETEEKEEEMKRRKLGRVNHGRLWKKRERIKKTQMGSKKNR